MAQPVAVDIQARTGQAVKELQSFKQQISAIAKTWEGVMGGKGAQTAGSNLQQLSKGVDRLGKSADDADRRFRLLSGSLDEVIKKRKALEAGGSVKLTDREQYKLLQDQERTLQRQATNWKTIAANRRSVFQQAQAQAQGQPSGGGPRGGNLARALLGIPFQVGGGILGRATGNFGQGAASSLLGTGGVTGLMEALGPALGAAVLAAVGFGVKGFTSAFQQDETLSRFLPRMFPGRMGGANTIGLARSMRGIGAPLGFNAEESLAITQAMSEGGSNFGRGLRRDTRAAMQFGRMFGIDAGGEAAMLATAQRTGAFQAGEARRFASMLATEIARTGLGPRAEEVQQATLMLLNRQMIDQPRAAAAPLMALQTILNKTGTPAFQGVAGAGFINQLQDAITHPNSEAAEALNFAVARRMGARTLYQYELTKAQGLNNPRFLPTLFQTIAQSAPNPEAQELALSQYFGQPLPKIHALRMGLGGSFANLTGGRLQATMKALQGQEGFLAKGAATTTEAFPSLQIKQAQILIHEATLRTGEGLLPSAGTLAGNFARGGNRALGAAGGNASPAEKGATIGSAIAAVFGQGKGTATEKALRGTGGVIGAIGDIIHRQGLGPYVAEKIGANKLDLWLQGLFGGNSGVRPGVHLGGLNAGAANSLLGAIHEMRAAGLHPMITDAFRTRAMQAARFRARQRGLSPYPAARPGHSAHERGEAVDISVPPGERGAVTGIMARHGFAHNVPGDPVHYNYVVNVHGVQHPHEVKKAVKQALDEVHRDHIMGRPNTRNMRG